MVLYREMISPGGE